MQNHVSPSIEEVNINNLRLSHTVQQSMMATLELRKDFVLMRNERDTLTELLRQQVDKLNALQEEFQMYKSEKQVTNHKILDGLQQLQLGTDFLNTGLPNIYNTIKDNEKITTDNNILLHKLDHVKYRSEPPHMGPNVNPTTNLRPIQADIQ